MGDWLPDYTHWSPQHFQKSSSQCLVLLAWVVLQLDAPVVKHMDSVFKVFLIVYRFCYLSFFWERCHLLNRYPLSDWLRWKARPNLYLVFSFRLYSIELVVGGGGGPPVFFLFFFQWHDLHYISLCYLLRPPLNHLVNWTPPFFSTPSPSTPMKAQIFLISLSPGETLARCCHYLLPRCNILWTHHSF